MNKDSLQNLLIEIVIKWKKNTPICRLLDCGTPSPKEPTYRQNPGTIKTNKQWHGQEMKMRLVSAQKTDDNFDILYRMSQWNNNKHQNPNQFVTDCNVLERVRYFCRENDFSIWTGLHCFCFIWLLRFCLFLQRGSRKRAWWACWPPRRQQNQKKKKKKKKTTPNSKIVFPTWMSKILLEFVKIWFQSVMKNIDFKYQFEPYGLKILNMMGAKHTGSTYSRARWYPYHSLLGT